MTGCTSVMLARAAEWNCSIFRKDGMLPMDTVIKEYLKLAVDYDNSPSNSKYCIQNILRELQETPRGRKFLECQTLEQIWYIIALNILNGNKEKYCFIICIVLTVLIFSVLYGTWTVIVKKNKVNIKRTVFKGGGK